MPPLITVQTTSVSVVLSTTISIRPSSMRILSPRLTSWGRPWKVTLETVLSPTTSLVVSVKICPSSSSTLGVEKLPVRISGPLVSRMVATEIPSCRQAARPLGVVILMGHVHSGHVHTVEHELFQHLRIVGRRSKGTDDLCFPHGNTPLFWILLFILKIYPLYSITQILETK